LFAVIGFILSLIILWNLTYDFRYDFKVKYLLRPKYKKGDYVLVPNRNNTPTLAQIKSIYTDWNAKEISYIVRPTFFGNGSIDFEYFEQLNFDEKCVFEIQAYYSIEAWNRMFEIDITTTEDSSAVQ